MKTIVVTDQRGKVTGLVRFEELEDEGAPDELRMEPVEGQLTHEIELPSELERIGLDHRPLRRTGTRIPGRREGGATDEEG